MPKKVACCLVSVGMGMGKSRLGAASLTAGKRHEDALTAYVPGGQAVSMPGGMPVEVVTQKDRDPFYGPSGKETFTGNQYPMLDLRHSLEERADFGRVMGDAII